MEEREK
jgi:hypothetical protein